MNKKTDIEMERAKTTKVLRTLIRLKYSLKADEEMNEVIPDTLSEFDKALASGELLSLQPAFDEILGDS